MNSFSSARWGTTGYLEKQKRWLLGVHQYANIDTGESRIGYLLISVADIYLFGYADGKENSPVKG